MHSLHIVGDARVLAEGEVSSEGTTIEGSDDGHSEPKVDANKVTWYENDPEVRTNHSGLSLRKRS